MNAVVCGGLSNKKEKANLKIDQNSFPLHSTQCSNKCRRKSYLKAFRSKIASILMPVKHMPTAGNNAMP